MIIVVGMHAMNIFVVSAREERPTHELKLVHTRINFLQSYIRNSMEIVNNRITRYVQKMSRTS